jgi:hypothetical protein
MDRDMSRGTSAELTLPRDAGEPAPKDVIAIEIAQYNHPRHGIAVFDPKAHSSPSQIGKVAKIDILARQDPCAEEKPPDSERRRGQFDTLWSDRLVAVIDNGGERPISSDDIHQALSMMLKPPVPDEKGNGDQYSHEPVCQAIQYRRAIVSWIQRGYKRSFVRARCGH